MSDSKPTKTAQQVAIPIEAYDKARRMAAAFQAQGKDTNMGLVAAEAIGEFYERLPVEVREFIESQQDETQATPQTV